MGSQGPGCKNKLVMFKPLLFSKNRILYVFLNYIDPFGLMLNFQQVPGLKFSIIWLLYVSIYACVCIILTSKIYDNTQVYILCICTCPRLHHTTSATCCCSKTWSGEKYTDPFTLGRRYLKGLYEDIRKVRCFHDAVE